MGYYTLVNHDHQLIFFWNAKCGCTTLKHVFYEISEGHAYRGGNIHRHIGFKNAHRYFWPRKDLEQLRGYTRVVVVRDPWTRLVSFYCEKIVKGSGETYLDCFKTFDGRAYSFREFVLALRLVRPMYLQHHLELQAAGIDDLRFDHVVPTTRLNEELQRILQTRDIDTERLSSLHTAKNQTPYDRSPWHTVDELKPEEYDPDRLPAPGRFYQDPRLIDVVHRVYRRDVEAFELPYPH